jgi:hypothetical protein
MGRSGMSSTLRDRAPIGLDPPQNRPVRSAA